MRTYVVIPTYHDDVNVVRLIAVLNSLLDNVRVIVVDDLGSASSPGPTKRLCSAYNNVTVLERPGKQGLGSATCVGLRAALADSECQHIVTMDADFSHSPSDVPRLLARSGEGRVVIGSRYVEDGRIMGWSIYRKLTSLGANLICRHILRTGVRDNTTNFRVYARQCAEAATAASSADFEWVIEALLHVRRRGYATCEVPTVFVDRTQGTSSLTPQYIVRWAKFMMREVVNASTS